MKTKEPRKAQDRLRPTKSASVKVGIKVKSGLRAGFKMGFSQMY